jgi:uncharacterized protein YajQ (UPF0234 family)
MIKDRQEKTNKIVNAIQSRISEINNRYRTGPDLYFYKKTIELRKKSQNINYFLNDDYYIEILYATLVSWDMNSRGAKMKYFDDFKANIRSCISEFQQLQAIEKGHDIDINKLLRLLNSAYTKLDLMKTNSKLVSNSKLLHFLFPTICMPMDRNNTLMYFYGNIGESEHKYLEIIQFSHEILKNNPSFVTLLDNNWNTTVAKMIDNAIILINNTSVK